MYSLIRDKWSKWKVVSSGAVILEKNSENVHEVETEEEQGKRQL